MRAVIDCRNDYLLMNRFLELNLWGKPCYTYVIDSVKESKCFSSITVLTNSLKIKDYCKNSYPDIKITSEHQNQVIGPVFIISGRAPCITSSTIISAVSEYSEHSIVSARKVMAYNFRGDFVAFCKGYSKEAFNAFFILTEKTSGNKETELFCIPDNEAVVINTLNDFELALVLKKKQKNRTMALQMIKKRIEDKKQVLSSGLNEKSVCLVGHSQMDRWDINNLADYKVRNCGISGISSFEYYDYILKRNILNCDADLFVVMHGTNDIVREYTINEMVESIERTISYIKIRNNTAPIIFISCLHTNGRTDRNNDKISELNTALMNKLSNTAVWVDTSFMDDKYGDLRLEYTSDGLHINESGYLLLGKRIEKIIRELL